MIVVDASVLVNALADDGPDGDHARGRLGADTDLRAPDLIDLEVVSVLRRRLRGDDLDERRADLALDDLAALPLTRYPPWALVGRIWELRDTLTPYDAAYVVLAEVLSCALVTADGRLSRAVGLRCPVELLEGG